MESLKFHPEEGEPSDEATTAPLTRNMDGPAEDIVKEDASSALRRENASSE